MPRLFSRKRIRRLIARYETRHKVRYRSPDGVPMIGVRFNLLRPDAPAKIRALGLQYRAVLAGKKSLTDKQIDQLFDADLDAAISHARKRIASFDRLSPPRQFVIVDLIFSLGPAAFDELEKAVAAVKVGVAGTTAHGMQPSAWFDQTGSHAGATGGVLGRGHWAAGLGVPSTGPGAPMAFGGSGGGDITPEGLSRAAQELAVDDIKDYAPHGKETQCSKFVRDFSDIVVGGDVPELVGQVADQAAALGESADWQALPYDEDKQSAFGQAQAFANEGRLVVVVWKNPKPTPGNTGHIAVVVPNAPSATSDDGTEWSEKWGLRVPYIAQAGTVVSPKMKLSYGFGPDKKDTLQIFVRDR